MALSPRELQSRGERRDTVGKEKSLVWEAVMHPQIRTQLSAQS